MSHKALWGWHPATNTWIPLQVSATGQLVIDPTAIFEQPPTLGELGKGATSNWCFLHNADPNRHHAAFTAADHLAIGDGAPHHARQHALDSAADHTGTITDAQHGVRTLANAHAHAHLSGIGADNHHPQAHTLASHTTKAHTELTGVTSDQHHSRQHAINAAADHTGVITDAQHGVRTLANAHAHAHLSGIGAADHHARYTDAEARAAAVSDQAYGAAWNGVTTIAPSKNAVYDKIETLGGIQATTGSYVGNNTANRAIAHGLGVTPKLVIICISTIATALGDWQWHIFSGVAQIYYFKGGANSSLAVTAPNGTNFYVGNATVYSLSANNTGESYAWVAIG